MRLVLFTLSIGVILVSVGLAAISAASPNWCVVFFALFASRKADLSVCFNVLQDLL